MLYDKNFLLQLDKSHNKVIYARIIALDLSDSPIESVEGRVTQGSINLDGTSAIRRTCSLTITANEFSYENYYWGLNTKFKLEIGVQNNIDSTYPDIIWFNQGIYIITSLNVSQSLTNFTLQIQGKDKMCLLNGEIGGAINAPTDFGIQENETAEGVWQQKKVPLKDIIRNMLHEYAGEPYRNIIINDLDDMGLELLEYRYDTPMYLYRLENSNIYENATLDGDIKCTVKGVSKTLKDLTPLELDLLVDPLMGTKDAPLVQIEGHSYYVAKVEFGQTAGYRLTDLVYAGDLIARVGENITSVLDKIKNMLGNFEYFYNLDGQFVFQRKKIFINTLDLPLEKDINEEIYAKSLVMSNSTSYYFSEGELFTTLSNKPNLNNMRNDYSVWGNRVSISGTDIPVHFRYAIDHKPQSYTLSTGAKTFTTKDCDWREILYQMAKDYFQHHEEDDFEEKVAKHNSEYPQGVTKYEQYYTDIEGFWRQIYCPQKEFEEPENKINKKISDKEKEMSKEQDKEKLDLLNKDLEALKKEKEKLLEKKESFYSSGDRINWNKTVFENPSALNFWIDFLDSEGELDQYNVKTVGVRTKAVNDTNIKSIYFRGTPEVIFHSGKEESYPYGSYKTIQVREDINTMFSISAQGKSAKDVLDDLVYKHGYCTESVTINTIPIYYLEPNTRIRITDKKTKLDGDYLIDKITIPLTYNGTMTISAVKTMENIMG